MRATASPQGTRGESRTHLRASEQGLLVSAAGSCLDSQEQQQQRRGQHQPLSVHLIRTSSSTPRKGLVALEGLGASLRFGKANCKLTRRRSCGTAKRTRSLSAIRAGTRIASGLARGQPTRLARLQPPGSRRQLKSEAGRCIPGTWYSMYEDPGFGVWIPGMYVGQPYGTVQARTA